MTNINNNESSKDLFVVSDRETEIIDMEVKSIWTPFANQVIKVFSLLANIYLVPS